MPFFDCRAVALPGEHLAVPFGHNRPTKVLGRSETLYIRIGPLSQILGPGERGKANRTKKDEMPF